MATREIRNLDELMDGALNERFNDEFAKVLANVYDPNTKPDQMRSIQIVVKIKPDESRAVAGFEMSVTTKLAPPVPMRQVVFIEQHDNGTVVATEKTNQVPGQMDMDGGVNIPNVIEFGKMKGEASNG